MAEPWSGLLVPVPVDRLREYAEGRRLVVGTGEYHAIVEDEPGDAAWARAIAAELSQDYDGEHYVFHRHPDFEALTIIVDGEETFDDDGAIDEIAQQRGVPLARPRAPVRHKSYLVAEGATPEDVTRALGGRPAPRRHLEPTPIGTVGWVDDGDLGFFARPVSASLNCRAFSVVDGPQRFAITVFEQGTETGRFEQPRTAWCEQLPVAEIRGATTRDEILRALCIRDH